MLVVFRTQAFTLLDPNGFTIPQFPIRLYFSKEFQIKDKAPAGKCGIGK